MKKNVLFGIMIFVVLSIFFVINVNAAPSCTNSSYIMNYINAHEADDYDTMWEQLNYDYQGMWVNKNDMISKLKIHDSLFETAYGDLVSKYTIVYSIYLVKAYPDEIFLCRVYLKDFYSTIFFPKIESTKIKDFYLHRDGGIINIIKTYEYFRAVPK
jgi:hypothetical protein